MDVDALLVDAARACVDLAEAEIAAACLGDDRASAAALDGLEQRGDPRLGPLLLAFVVADPQATDAARRLGRLGDEAVWTAAWTSATASSG